MTIQEKLTQCRKELSAKNYRAAYALCKELFESNDPVGMNIMGIFYEQGHVVPQNTEKAEELYLKSAAMGCAAAMYNLGLLYNTKESFVKALEYFKSAAEHGFVKSYFWLGYFYENGLGVEQNYENAVLYYEKAVNENLDDARYNLGKLYAMGIGVPENETEKYLKIADWYRNATKIFDINGLYPEFKLVKCYADNPQAGNFSYKTGTLNLPYGVKTVGERCFFLAEIKNIILPEGVESIEDSAFSSSIMLKSVTLPSTLRTIGKNAFCDTGLRELELPEGIERIEEETFKKCDLVCVIIPKSVKYIGKSAFEDCKKLRKIYIPDSVETIDYDAFKGCSKLGIYLETDVKPTYPEEIREETFERSYISGGYDYHRAGAANDDIEQYVTKYTYTEPVCHGWNPDKRAVHKNVSLEKFKELIEKPKND